MKPKDCKQPGVHADRPGPWRLLRLGLMCLACVTGSALAGPADTLASAPFAIVAPFPPGGPVDTLARMLSTGLSTRYRQAAVVDNRAGANGNIGIDYVKRAAPDGHTLLVVPAGNLTINPSLMPRLGYDVARDFDPVSTLAQAPNVLAVNPAVPAQNVAELVALSKAHPGTMSYASPGVGSGLHLAGELFRRQSGADLLHIAYKGSGPGLNDVLGGTVPVIMGNLPTLLPYIQAGRLRALALTDPERSPLLPQVPTLAEAGVHGIAVTSWYGVLVPHGTPESLRTQLAQDIAQILALPANKALLERQGLTVWLHAGDAFSQIIRQESATWLPVIRSQHIVAE